MKMFHKLLLLVLSTILLSACTWGERYTKNPNSPEDVTLATLLPTAQMQIAYAMGGDAVRYNGVLTQHFGGVDRQHQVIDRYGFTESDVTNAWGSFWAGMKQLALIVEKAEETDNLLYAGVAKVHMAHCYGLMTDLWGDIPFGNALTASPETGFEGTAPTYDAQEQVYAGIFALLDEAIANINDPNSSNLNAPGAEDAIFGGDPDLWVAAAYALKARHYLNVSQRSSAYPDFASQAIEAVDSAQAYGFTSMQFANFESNFAQGNPAFMFDAYRFDIRAGAYFVNLMKDRSDPRLSLLINPVGSDFVGAEAGNGDASASDLYFTYYVSPLSPVTYLIEPELALIEAEAALREGDDTRAQTAFTAAIEASLTAIVDEPEPDSAYLADYGTLEGDFEAKLEQIITEKYIANSWNAQTYIDFRRTGYPEIPLLQGAIFPIRWPYAQDERIANSANVPAANIATPVWWDVD